MAEPQKPVPDNSSLESPEIDKAVDDVAAKESDEVLAAQDAAVAAAFKPADKPHGIIAKCKHALKTWWNNPKARWGTIAGVAAALLIIGIVPPSRYFVLNTVGVRSGASVLVLDTSTRQPLKNVQVSLANQTAKTDSDGMARLSDVKLGATELKIERYAFAPHGRRVTVGWGSNPLGDVQLTPTGAQYTFKVTDFLSGKPVAKAEATSGEAEAIANDEGEIVLTLEGSDAETIPVVITASTYRDEIVGLNPADKATRDVQMVPARKHAFVSKRSGKFDVYAVDVDGRNERLLLAGSGFERDDIVVAPQPEGDLVAVVSTRDNLRNREGYLLSGLGIVNSQTGEMVNVAQSEKIQLVNWQGDRLVYVQIAAGASASDPKRQRLMSYNYETGQAQELAASNYFNDVLSAKGAIYYAPSDAHQAAQPALYKVNPDGSGYQTLLNRSVWNIFRTDYNNLSLSVGQDWYAYRLGEPQAGRVSGPPADLKNRLYRDNRDGQHSLWVDNRDGKGVLLEYNVTAGSDAILRSQSGLSNPVSWLNDRYVVYRIHTDQETADYVLNLNGGEPRKIGDVTNSRGIDQWYYYQ